MESNRDENVSARRYHLDRKAKIVYSNQALICFFNFLSSDHKNKLHLTRDFHRNKILKTELF